MEIEKVLLKRNENWINKKEIPSWVNLENVSLDQFYTEEEVAKKYYENMCVFLKERNIELEDCLFVEPSAGKGVFLKLMPKKQRIGIDLYPLDKEIIEMDFLEWIPPKTNKKIIVVGNPPFGYRAWLALAFINHAAKFADFIFFILPMSFNSEAKGSPRKRVKGMKNVHSELIENNNYKTLDGKMKKVNALWQCWEKGEEKHVETKDIKHLVDVFTVDQRKERMCGHKKIGEANFFIQRTFYTEPPNLVKSFSDVKYVCGYGFILKKNKEKIKKLLKEADWLKYSNLTTHNCRHISLYHIKKVLLDGGVL